MIDRINYTAPSYSASSNRITNQPSSVVAGKRYQSSAASDSVSTKNSVKDNPTTTAGNNNVIPFPTGQQACLENRPAKSEPTLSTATAAYGKTVEDKKISDKLLKRLGLEECQTCQERTYQDESTDPGVSFKSPTHIDPANAGAAVAAHEQEHVRNQQANAAQEEKQIVSQSVKIFTSACPECGKVYVSGGETRTVTATKSAPANNDSGKGQLLDRYA